MEQHRRPDPDAIAVDGCNQRSLARGERSKEPPDRDVLAVARDGFQEIGEVVAGREILTLAAEGDQADGFVDRGLFHRVRERCVHCDGDGIAPLGARKHDRKHRALFLHPYMLAHLPLPNRVTRRKAPAISPSSTKAGTSTKRHEILRRYRRNIRNPGAR